MSVSKHFSTTAYSHMPLLNNSEGTAFNQLGSHQTLKKFLAFHIISKNITKSQ